MSRKKDAKVSLLFVKSGNECLNFNAELTKRCSRFLRMSAKQIMDVNDESDTRDVILVRLLKSYIKMDI